VFASIVAMTSIDLPVAGRLANFNKAVGANGYVGVKTGSDSTAGGCLVFANRQTVAGRPVTVLGVIIGQDRGQVATSALITAAVNAANALVQSVLPAVADRTVLPTGTVVAELSNASGQRSPVVTTSPLRLMGYGGMAVPLSVSFAPTSTRAGAGDVMGRVTIPGGGFTTVTARSGVPAASFGWKLTHDY
jgi:D-alanyl-D-alanine carboxypeptidase (penicillin-binding protein 5/6)